MEYNFREIEPKWQKYWVEHQTYKVVENKEKEKEKEDQLHQKMILLLVILFSLSHSVVICLICLSE